MLVAVGDNEGAGDKVRVAVDNGVAVAISVGGGAAVGAGAQAASSMSTGRIASRIRLIFPRALS